MSGYRPTHLQAEIRDERVDDLLIVAPPGCGKTEALAIRALGLIDSRQVVTPKKILTVSFSNRAKANIGERMIRFLGERRFSRYVTLANFHGLAARILRSHANVIGMDINEWAFPAHDGLSEAMQVRGLSWPQRKEVSDLTEATKRHPLDDLQVLERLSANQLAFDLEQDRQSSKRLDYSDLLRLAQIILQDDRVANLYRQHFAFVLVDEFQDLSTQQLSLVRAVGRRFTFAGDPGQGIYSFAGGDPRGVQAEIESSGARPVLLHESHRSSPAVLKSVNAVAEHLGLPAMKSAKPSKWPSGGVSCVANFRDYAVESSSLLRAITAIMKKSPNARVGLAARRWKRLETCAELFDRECAFPVRHWNIAAHTPAVISTLRSLYASMNLSEMRDQLQAVESLRVSCLTLISVDDVDTYSEVREALLWVHDKVAEGESLESVLSSLVVLSPDDFAVGPGVHFLSAHAGKGQQFDWVFAVGLENGQVPDFRATEPEIEEEERILLVILSRARYGLVATRARTRLTRYSIQSQEPSPWWPLLESSASCQAEALMGLIDTSGFESTVD